MNLLLASLHNAAAMLWQMLWPLVLGFGISAALQVVVSKDAMARAFGRTGLKEVLVATGLGAASSSCSYAAAAAAHTAFKRGASFVPAMAFMIASTNLVVELGLVLWTLMGWRFVLAECVGAIVMIAIVWGVVAIRPPRKLIEAARAHDVEGEDGGCCHGHEHGRADEAPRSKLLQVADAFIMDWSMLWKEILIGVAIAGVLMTLVPAGFWQGLFISNGPEPWRTLENAAVGPLVAAASFVCSIGNVPFAALLWASGASFGGVVAFIYGDLIVLPLISAYRKYYGWKMAAYITAILYSAMALAGLVTEYLFQALGLLDNLPARSMAMASVDFAWDYTTWLNLAALLIGGGLFLLHLRGQTSGPSAREHDAHAEEEHVHHGH